MLFSMILLVGCSALNQPSIELTNKSVDIHIAENDRQHLEIRIKSSRGKFLSRKTFLDIIFL